MKYICIAALLCLLAGCQQPPAKHVGYQTLPAQEQPNTDKAREFNAKGTAELEKNDLAAAEKIFKEALASLTSARRNSTWPRGSSSTPSSSCPTNPSRGTTWA